MTDKENPVGAILGLIARAVADDDSRYVTALAELDPQTRHLRDEVLHLLKVNKTTPPFAISALLHAAAYMIVTESEYDDAPERQVSTEAVKVLKRVSTKALELAVEQALSQAEDDGAILVIRRPTKDSKDKQPKEHHKQGDTPASDAVHGHSRAPAGPAEGLTDVTGTTGTTDETAFGGERASGTEG